VIGDGPNQISWEKTKLAMAARSKNTHYKLGEIQPRHWQQLAHKSGIDGAWDAMVAMLDKVDVAVETVSNRLPATYPMRVAEKIFTGLRSQAKVFQEGKLKKTVNPVPEIGPKTRGFSIRRSTN
jgi:serine/threonine-protein kinase HipA